MRMSLEKPKLKGKQTRDEGDVDDDGDKPKKSNTTMILIIVGVAIFSMSYRAAIIGSISSSAIKF